MIRLGPSLLCLFMGGASALSGPKIQAQEGGPKVPGPGESKPAEVARPDAASEGERDLAKATPVLKKWVASQPYGRSWRSLARGLPPPASRAGLGDAEAPRALANDPAEVQQQSQYLEPTATEVRYGFVSVRGVRVFRFGRLRGARLLVEQIGRSTREGFVEDVQALSAAWSNPAASLGLEGGFTVARNDLVDPKKKQSSEWPKPPLVIELVPRERAAR